MRTLFAIVFAVMVGFTFLIARARQPVRTTKTVLTWTSDDNPQRKEQRELFGRLNPDLQLRLDPNNEGMEKVIVQTMGGVGPDLFDCRSATQLSAYVRAGIAMDVTDALRSHQIDLRSDIWPAVLPLCVWKGRSYGVPTNIAPNAVWIHRDVLRQAGIAEPHGPWHWDDLIHLAQKLTVRDKQGRPIRFGFMFDWYLWQHFLKGFGARVFNDTGTRCTLDSPEAAQAVQLMHDLVYKYRVSPNPTEESSLASRGGWGTGTINLFGAKMGAMALGGRWWLVNLRQFSGLDLGVIESPFATNREYDAIGRATLINRFSPRRSEALRFLLYEASGDYARLIDRQADGSPAFKREAANVGRGTGNTKQRPLDGSDVWIQEARIATPDWTSPYVDGNEVDRIVNAQLDLVRVGVKSAQQAMKAASEQINAEIRDNIAEDPELKALWLRAEARG